MFQRLLMKVHNMRDKVVFLPISDLRMPASMQECSELHINCVRTHPVCGHFLPGVQIMLKWIVGYMAAQKAVEQK